MSGRLRALLFVGLLTLAGPAVAQETGGSFGGGDWGSDDTDTGGGSYGGGGSYDYGSSDTSYDSSDTSYDSSGDDDPGWGDDWGGGSGGGSGGGESWLCTILAPLPFLFLFVVVPLLEMYSGWASRRPYRGPHTPRGKRSRARASHRNVREPQATRKWTQVDISQVRLGLDWRARPLVQERLDELASAGKTHSKEGRAQLLRETTQLLERVRHSWLYLDVGNHRPMSQSAGQGTFERLAIDARARFQKELVRAEDGTVTRTDAGEHSAHPHEGEGVVVVTLLVAARCELIDVYEGTDATAVTELLTHLGALTPKQLVALEVVWSPAAEDDRMSTAELEGRYPELHKLDEESIGGRVFCDYCRGPYAEELLVCPHCGAPGAEARPPAEV